MLVVATVPHSGTMQLVKILGGLRRGMRSIAEKHFGGAEILTAHLSDEEMPLIEQESNAGAMVLTTRRPVSDIRASWQRRGEDLAQLERHLANYQRLLALQPYVLELGRWR